jgi:hypothetical protein
MASSRSRTQASRPARASKSKAAPRKAQVEVVEEAGGGGIDAGIAIITTLLLVAAFLFMDKNLGEHYGAGALFADSYTAPN